MNNPIKPVHAPVRSLPYASRFEEKPPRPQTKKKVKKKVEPDDDETPQKIDEYA